MRILNIMRVCETGLLFMYPEPSIMFQLDNQFETSGNCE